MDLYLNMPKYIFIFSINLFYTLNKTPSGEIRCLSNLYYLLAAQICNFLIHPLSRKQSVRAPLVPYHSLCSTCVTYEMSCHSIGHQVILIKCLPMEADDFPRGGEYPERILFVVQR